MIQGSCCCGEVRFSISRTPRVRCGVPLLEMPEARSDALRHDRGRASSSLSGRERIVEFLPEPPFKYRRCFCGKCGTSLGEMLSTDKLFPGAGELLRSGSRRRDPLSRARGDQARVVRDSRRQQAVRRRPRLSRVLAPPSLAVCVALAWGCGAPVATQDRVSADGYGGVRVGMSVEEAATAFGATLRPRTDRRRRTLLSLRVSGR